MIFKSFINSTTSVLLKQCKRRTLHLTPQSAMSTNVSTMTSQSKERQAFQETYNVVIDTIVSSPKFTEIPEIGAWIKKILDYNLTGGKKHRGLTTVMSYQMLEKPENISEETLKLARILGWCVELLHAFFVVGDDIMDASTTRRGVPCWYKVPDVGLGAINDGILIYNSVFEILYTHFRKLPQYVDILELFNETVLYTASGQHLDKIMSSIRNNDYESFTVEKYESIIKYKTAYYTYPLPVSLGMLLANITDAETRKKSDLVCLEIGKFFQIQDDFIDCFSDESITGKAGTDIQERKCSWLAVSALQRCNSSQRRLFEQYYGSKDPDHVQRIKQLYEALNLPKVYKKQERLKYDEIVKMAKKLSRDTRLSADLFVKLIDMIYKRNK